MTTDLGRLAIVGCGRLAELGYLPALAHSGRWRLVAVADHDPGRRERVATAAGLSRGPRVETFGGAAALLEATEVDAVVLATPAGAHVVDAALCAEAGVVTLVEKPPAPDAHGALELARRAPQARVGFNRRFDPGARDVRSAVPAVGPFELRLEISYRRRAWAAHVVRDDALGDLGPHLVDWARFIGGSEVLEVRGADVKPNRACLDLALERGRAVIRASTDRPHRELVELRGREGEVLARHVLGGLATAVLGRLRPPEGPSPLVRSLAAELDALAQVVGGGRATELATSADGAAVMAVVDAARTSATRGGRVVAVAETPAG